jgi:CBS domain-containing protein
VPSYLQDRIKSLEPREPVFVPLDETLRAVGHTMWVEDVGAVVVGDHRRAVGVISERDLVSQIAHWVDLDARTAGEAMTSHLVSARAEDSLDYAAYRMLESTIRHLPVTDGEGRVVGMVSIRDLLRPFLSARL